MLRQGPLSVVWLYLFQGEDVQTLSTDKGSVFAAEETQTFIANKLINWKFNLGRCSLARGVWERLVANVKGGGCKEGSGGKHYNVRGTNTDRCELRGGSRRCFDAKPFNRRTSIGK